MDVRCKSKNVKILEQANKKYGHFCNHHSLTTGRRGYVSSHFGVIVTHTLYITLHYTTLHYITYYTLHITHRTLHNAHYTLHVTHYTLHITHFTFHITHYITH